MLCVVRKRGVRWADGECVVGVVCCEVEGCGLG